jgi:hypothetical protein
MAVAPAYGYGKFPRRNRSRARISTPAMTSERPVKKPLRVPKIDREWRTTLILASVAALLALAVVAVAATRSF